MVHVFVVNEITFRYHLEYKFAGTGAKDDLCYFLTEPRTNSIHSTTERNLVGMIADISRIREGDKIIFYLVATSNRQGMFFGVFQAASTAFFDENDQDNYLINYLGKGLTFRIIIEPDVVFPLGITEHEYLDSLEGKSHPFEMCWSLIYRKLKGNRGCTMITNFEFNDLLYKLQVKNNGNYIISNNFSFNTYDNTIVPQDVDKNYLGRKDSIGIRERMMYKANRNLAFETHLQAYITQNYDFEPLRNLLFTDPTIGCWIGNEVSCGVGMQRIDILMIQESTSDIYIKIIELKYTEPYNDILDWQIPWYIDWVIDYIVPTYTSSNKQIHIIPCIIAKETNNNDFINRARSFIYHSNRVTLDIEKLEYLAFRITNQNINFHRII